jgi:transposase InsO family protein
MFWHHMLIPLSPCYVLVLRLLRDDRDRQILALRQQVLILQRQVGKRPSLNRIERLGLVLSGLPLVRRKLADAIMIVRPATLVDWHREIVHRHWTFHSPRRPGRPKVPAEAEQLVLQIARENPRMGYGRIAGEMRKLGFRRFGRSTVVRILKKHGITRDPARRQEMGWATFLKHYQQFIWAGDFFTVTTATLRTYYVLFFIEMGTRRIRFWNVSESPDGLWVARQFRNLSVVNDELPKYVLHDRDDKFTAAADSVLLDVATSVVKLPARSPDLNGFAERWIRTIRQECLDRIVILNERHLRWVLAEFVRYYNARRPHQRLHLHVPDGPFEYPRHGAVAYHQVLGGLTNDYYRLAA